MTEITRLVRMLNKTFTKGAWHGPSVQDVLLQIIPSQIHLRVGKSHSILELVLHMISWRTFTVKRLRGDNDFQVSDEINFPSAATETWAGAMKQLEESQQELVDAVTQFSADRLGERVQGSSHKYTYYTLVHGIIHHDIYHIGQIQLILKAHAQA